MIQIKTFAFNPFQVNTYVLYNEHKECIIVDAACYSEREKEILTAFIDDNELNLKLLINTHCHVDHILGVHYIKERYNVPFYACPKDQYLLDTSIDHARGYGFDFADVPVIDKEVFTGDTIPFGEDSLSIIEAPGHTKGSILIHSEPNNLLYTGDVLFYGSI